MFQTSGTLAPQTFMTCSISKWSIDGVPFQEHFIYLNVILIPQIAQNKLTHNSCLPLTTLSQTRWIVPGRCCTRLLLRATCMTMYKFRAGQPGNGFKHCYFFLPYDQYFSVVRFNSCCLKTPDFDFCAGVSCDESLRDTVHQCFCSKNKDRKALFAIVFVKICFTRLLKIGQ